MKKINIIILVTICLVLPTVLAGLSDDDVRFIGTQDQELDIKEQCFNNNSYCSSSGVCNITIKNPEQVILVNNMLMTNQNSFHNYTINSANTSTFGIYEATVVCADGTNKGYDTFFFKISPTGFVSKPEYVTGLGVLLIGLLLFLIYLSKSISEEYQRIKLLFNWFTLILLIPIIWFIKLIASNFNTTIGDMMVYIYYGYVPIFMFMSFYFVVIFIMQTIDSMKQKKQQKENDFLRVK